MRPTVTIQGGTSAGPGEDVLSVGISDLIANRECPRRAAYGSRRHIGVGMQSTSTTPEAGSPATWYGSCIHDAVEASEDGLSDETAIELAWAKWGHALEPGDLALLKDDMALYHERDATNVRTVLSEGEIIVPLTEMPDGRPIFFRGRIDRLYESLDRPGYFIHRDYKSSKWIKSQEEVDNDQQMWAYNWALCDYFPEIEELHQELDFLKGGIVPTGKTPEEREQMREWLAISARNYFAVREGEMEPDGLPAPRKNDWCPWCPILESCQIVPHLSDWALSRINALRPPSMKDGDSSEFTEAMEAVTPIDEYMAQYDDAKLAIKVLKRYEDSARALVHDMSEEERDRLGFELRGRSNSFIPVPARSALYEALGHDRFMELAGITQEKLKTAFADEEQREWALSLVEKRAGNQVVYRRR